MEIKSFRCLKNVNQIKIRFIGSDYRFRIIFNHCAMWPSREKLFYFVVSKDNSTVDLNFGAGRWLGFSSLRAKITTRSLDPGPFDLYSTVISG